MLSISKKLIRVLLVVIHIPLFLLSFTIATSIPTTVGILHVYSHITRPAPSLALIEPNYLGEVLSEHDSLLRGDITFNIPTRFGEQVSVRQNLEVGGESTFSGNIRVIDRNVDAGAGSVFAANLLYGVLPGSGITISTGQTPTISSTGVLSIGGQTGEVELLGGTGISVDGSTIINTDRGSDQKMFKFVNVEGEAIIEASNSIETLRLIAGTGIDLEANSGDKSITINSLGSTTASGWTDGGTAVYLTTLTDNVGIGTETPNAKLHVAGDGQIDGGLSVGFAGGGEDDRLYIGDADFYLDMGNAIADSALIGFDSTDYLEFNRTDNRYSFFVGGAEMSRIDGTAFYASTIRDISGGNIILQDDGGNVGIGTSSPVAKLHVAGDGTVSAIFTSGNVGIGTTAPGQALDVVGGVRVSGLSSGSGSALCLDGSNNLITCVTGSGGLSGSGTVNQLAFFDTATSVTSDSDLYWNNATKRFGIGTTSPTVRLQVEGDGTYSASFLNGNVGIGTTAPSSALHVVGNGYISGQIAAGTSSVTLTTVDGYIDADAIQLFSSLGTGGTSSSSGLEIISNRIGLLQGCANGQILKWNETSSLWECASDSGATSAIINVEADGTAIGSNVDTLNFGPDFSVTASPVNRANVAIADDVLNFSELSDSLVVDSNTSVNLYNGSGSTALRFFNSNTTAELLQIDGTTGRIGIGITAPSAKLHVVGNGTNAAVFMSGNVGIGNTSPSSLFAVGSSSQFQVNSSGAITEATGITSSGTIIFSGLGDGLIKSTSGVLSVASVGDDYQAPLSFSNGLTLSSNTVTLGGALSGNTTLVDGGFNFNIAGTGNVGIGTSSPIAKLNVIGNGTSAAIFTSGNVGIGTTAPAFTLDIAGTLRATDYYSGDGTQGSTSTVSGLEFKDGLFTSGSISGFDNYQYWTLAGDTGSSNITSTGTASFLGGVGISTSQAGGAITITNVLGTSIDTSEITDGTILEADLSVTNGPTDNYVLTYDQGTGGFTWVDPATTGAVDGSGIANYVTRWSDANTLTTGQLYDDGTNVGIGTSAPSSRLHVVGNGTNSAVFMSGNVGVGTTSPSSLFAVGSSSQFQINSTGSITAATGITSSGSITFSGLGTGLVRSVAGVLSNATAGTDYQSPLSFTNGLTLSSNTVTLGGTLTGNTTLVNGGFNFNIVGAGNVGIGTTNPLQALDIVGNANISSGSTFKINGTDVLTSSTLGTGVTSSSLVSVGALNSGSITSGFGTIATGNNITTTANISTTGTGTITSAGTLTASGDLVVNGNTTLGNAGGDTVTFNSAALTFANPSTLDLANSSTIALTIESGLFNIDTQNARIGIGTTAPSQTLDILGAIRLGANGGANDVLNTTAAGGGPSGNLFWGSRTLCDNSGNCAGSGAGIGGSGTANFITKFDNQFSVTNSGIYDDAGFIGIGTTAPSSRLHIVGNGTTAAVFTSGNVGVGTTAPGGLFAVGSSSQFAINSTGSITAATGITSSGSITFSGLGTGLVRSVAGVLSNASAGTDYQAPLSFSNGLTLSSNTVTLGGTLSSDTIINDGGNDFSISGGAGNVGIGTTAPSTKLHVVGGLRVTGAFIDSSNSAGTDGFVLTSTGTGTATAWTSISGAVGSTAFIQGGNSFGALAQLGTNDNNSLGIRTSGVERVRISTDGRVGIGTTAPGYMLDINGTLRAADYYSGDGTQGSTSTVSGLEFKDGLFTSGSISGFDNYQYWTLAGDTGSSNITSTGTASFLGGVGISTSQAGGAITITNVLGTSIDTSEITDGTILEADLSVTNGPTDNYVLTYDQGTGGFTWVDPATTGAVDGSGIANYVTRWSDANTLTTGQLYDDGTNVGIGTSAPSSRLHVVGNGTNAAVFMSGNVGVGTTAPAGLFAVGSSSQFAINSTGAITAATGITSSGSITFSGLGTGLVRSDSGVLSNAVAGTDYQSPLSFSNGLTLSSNTVTLGGTLTGNTTLVNGGFNFNIAGTGNVGIGTSSPLAKLHVVGNGTTAAAFMSGNVGIGTTSPGYALEVQGDLKIGDSGTTIPRLILGSSATDPTSVSGAMYYNTTANRFMCNRDGVWSDCSGSSNFDGSGTAGQVTYWTDGDSFSGNNNFYWDIATNRLGLGTTAPSARLSVFGDGTNAATFMSGNVGIGTTAPGGLFAVGSSSQFAINSTGSITAATGITSSGTISFTGLTSSTGTAICLDGSNNLVTCTTGAGGIAGSGAATQLAFFDGVSSITSDSNLYFDNTDKFLGLGTSAPTARLQVVGDGTTSALFTSGNVGVGNTAPGNLFVVGSSGQFSIDSSGDIKTIKGVSYSFPNATAAGNNYVLTSDTSGVLTWSSVSGAGGIAGNGTANYIPIWSDESTLADSLLYQTGGNIGIGTTDPGYKLEVAGDIKIGDSGATISRLILGSSTADPTGVAGATYYNTSTNKFRCYENGSWINCIASAGITGSGTEGQVTFWTGSSAQSGDDSFFFDNSSKYLGIGTTLPGARLHVVGNGTSAAIFASGNVGIGTTSPSSLFAVGSSSQFQVNSSGAITAATGITSSGSITFSGLGTGLVRSVAGVLSNATAGTDYQSPLSFTNGLTLSSNTVTLGGALSGNTTLVNGGFNFNIAGTGNVGIGTSSPIAKLNVVGNGTSAAIFTSGNVGVGTTSPSSLFAVGSSSQFQVNSTGAIGAATGITSSGTITFSGLGDGLVKSTSGVLSAATAGTDYQSPLSFSNGLTLSSNTVTLGGTLTGNTTLVNGGFNFNIAGTGNVGIGTSSPLVKLHVVGNGTNTAAFMSGNVGVGTTSPSSLFAVGSTSQFQVNSAGAVTSASGITSAGTISFTGLGGGSGDAICLDGSNNLVTCTVGSGGLSGSGTTNYIPIFTSGSSLGNSGLYETGGNVGLGTTVPGARLHVVGNGTSAAIFTSGNVGIGTTAPGYGLEVAGTGRFGGTLSLGTVNSTANNNQVLTLDSGVVSYIDTTNWDTDSSDDFAGITGTDNRLARFNAAGDNVEDGSINDLYAGGVALTLNASGNLGVGTTSPSSLFAVGSSSQFQVNSSGAITAATGITSSGSITFSGLGTGLVRSVSGVLSNAVAGTDYQSPLSFTNGLTLSSNTVTLGGALTGNTTLADGGFNFNIAGTGNVGIGTSSPIAKLNVIGNGTSAAIFTSGNVGIGTTAPGYMLDINGTLRAADYYSGDGTQGSTSTVSGLEFKDGLFTSGSISGFDNYQYWTLAGDTGSSNITSTGTASFLGGVGISTSQAGGAITITNVLGTSIDTSEITDGTILEADLSVTNGPTDNYVLTYDQGTGGFTWVDPATTGAVDGSGIANYVTRWSDANTLTTGQLYDDGTNVGIGTSAPSSRLHVVGNGTNSAVFMSGNVGVGTTAPSSLFSVGSSSGFRVNDAGAITAATGITSSGTITFSGLGDGLVKSTSGVLSAATAGTDYQSPLSFTNGLTLSSNTVTLGGALSGNTTLVNGGFNFNIAGTGNVGIGTSSPIAKLNVVGNGTSAAIFTSGNVGIGTTAPAFTLDIAGTLRATDYYSGDGTQGSTSTVSGLEFKDGLFTSGSISGFDNYQYWTLAGDTGSSNISSTGTATFVGGVGISTSEAGGSITITNVLGTSIESSEITDGTILEADLSVTNGPTDNYILTYDQGSGGFTWVDPATTGAFDGSGIANYVTRWSDANTLTTGQLYDDGTNVGIGTSAPSSRLHVVGNGTNAATFMSGNVGIGTTSPSSLFAVGSSSQFQINSTGSITAATGITSSGTITFSGLGDGLVKSTSGVLSAATAGTDYQSPLSFTNGLTLSSNTVTLGGALSGNTTLVNGGFNFNIAGTGNVGIGTSSPIAKLNVVGNGTSAAIFTSGNVGIGTTAPGYGLEVAGTGRFGGTLSLGTVNSTANNNQVLTLDSGVVSYIDTTNWDTDSSDDFAGITGTDNRLARFNAAGDNVEDGSINDLYAGGVALTLNASGNLGVGTTSPSSLFAVGSSSQFQVNSSGAITAATGITSSGSITFSGLGTGLVRSVSGVLSNAVAGTDYQSPLSFSNGLTLSSNTVTLGGALTGNTTLADGGFNFNIAGTGNVGIGTSSPLTKLHVVGNGTTAAAFMSGNVGVGTTSPSSLFAVGSSSGFTVNDSGAVTAATGITSSGSITFSGLGTGLVQSTSGVLSNAVAGVDYESALSFSNGLTRTSNSVTLGGALTEDTTLTDGGFNLNISGGAGRVGIGTSSPGAKLHVEGNGTTAAVFTSGNVGIGTTAPSQALDIGGSGANLTFSSGTGPHQILTGGTTDLALMPGGNVGIGLTNPTYKLDVLTTSTSVGALNLAGNSLTTGTALNLNVNSLTSGRGLSIGSTSTALTTGNLLNINWSPTASTTSTGDLVVIGIGSSGNLGNLFNITDSGSSIFSVSESVITSNLPAAFNAPGATSFAYDINLTNETSGNIKSNGPLYIKAGDTYESNDLTLRTYNSGNIVLDLTGDDSSVQIVGTDASLVFDTRTASDTDYWMGVVNDESNDDDDKFVLGKGTIPGSNRLLTINADGNLGIGTTDPTGLFTVGAASQFRVNSSGVITSASGITSAGTISFTGLGGGSGDAICLDGSNNLVTCTVGSGGLSGSGTTNYIPIFTGASSIGNSGLYQTGGNVGLGTTVPGARLHVVGDGTRAAAFMSGNVGVGTTSPSSLFAVGSSSQFQVDSTGAITAATGITSSGSITFSGLGTGLVRSVSGVLSNASAGTDYQAPLSFSNGLTNSSNTVTLGGTLTANTTIAQGAFNVIFTGTGNIGIGTTNPSGKLTVIAPANAPTTLGITSAAGSSPATIVEYVYGATANNVGGRATIQSINGVDTFGLAGASSRALSLAASASVTPHLLIETGGDIGIGTTNPAYKLDVEGTMRATGNVNFSGLAAGGANTAVLALDGSNNVETLDISGYDTDASDDLSFTGTPGYLSYFDSSSSLANSALFNTGGNVGLGTTVPGVRLHVVGDGTRAAAFMSGNVGVGTTNPSSLFSVGSSSQFQVDSTGAIAAATGITSSGTYNLSSLASGLVKSTSGILSIASAGSDYESGLSFSNGLTRSSNTITLGGTLTGNTTFINGGNSFNVVGTGNVGIGTSSPAAKFNVIGNGTNAAVFESGNVGIGTTAPSSLFAVGSSSQFAINSSGAITAATGITSSGTITFSGLSNGLVKSTSGVLSAAVAGTDFQSPLSFSNGLTLSSNTVTLGGALTGSTTIVSGSNNFNIAGGTGRVGIGTSSPGSKLSIAGGVAIGTTATASTYHSSAAPSGGLIVEGNVGIGTTAPTIKLHVVGNGTNTAAFMSGNVGVGTSSPNVRLHVVGNGTNAATFMSGNVGIGTTSPAAALAVGANAFTVNSTGAITAATGITSSGTITFSGLSNGLVKSTSGVLSAAVAGTDFQSPLSFSNGLTLSSNTVTFGGALTGNTTLVNGGFNFNIAGAGNVGIGTSSPIAKLNVVGNGTNAAIFTSGNVGIGTTAPAAALDIVGDIQLTGGVSVGFSGDGQDDRLYIGDAAFYLDLNNVVADSAIFSLDTTDYLEYNRTDNRYSFFVGGTERTRIDGSGLYTNAIRDLSGGNISLQDDGGNVGIGITAPTVKLHVVGNGTYSAAFMSGNVGIGTTSPSSLFAVGSSSQFQVNSTGAIGAATGITSSGSITFSGLGTGLVRSVSGVLSNAVAGTDYQSPLSFSNGLTLSSNTVTLGGALTGNTTLVSGSNNFSIAGGTGRVGIGTSSPGSKLSVSGGVAIGTTSASSTYHSSIAPDGGLIIEGNIGIGTTSPTSKVELASGTFKLNNGTLLDLSSINHSSTIPQGLRLPQNTTASLLNPNTGEGYLAWSTDDDKLQVYDGSTWTDVATGGTTLFTDQDTYINANNYLNFVITDAGNVGIGTSSPAARLGVVGNGTTAAVFTSGNVGIGTTAPGSLLELVDAGTTTNSFNLTSNALTTGTALNLNVNSLTSGRGLSIGSTSTALTTGNLLNINWSPTASTTSTGDLVVIGIGSSGNLGNIFNITDSGNSLFSVSETAITSALPHAFTAAGDLSVAYDMVFTNQTASYIKSLGPLTIESGEAFENNNLTLKTYGAGKIILDGSGAEITGNLTVGSFASSGTAALCWDNSGSSTINDCSGTPAADYMEFYPTDGSIQIADIVVPSTDYTVTTTGERIAILKKSDRPYDSRMIGILSDKEKAGDFNSIGYNIKDEDNPQPVALNGRVYVKVSNSSDAIEPGDFVTASSDPGKGIKATQAGYVVGKALESWEPNSGKDTVLVFVNVIWRDPGIYLTGEGTVASVKSENSDINIATTSDGTQTIDNMALDILDLEGKVASLSSALQSMIDSQDITEVASLSARIDNLEARADATDNTVASVSARLAFLEQQLLGSESAVLGTATGSALFAEDQIATLAALTVMGKTNLYDLGVAGVITNGLLSINGYDDSLAIPAATINSFGGALKLQSHALADLDIMDGKVVIDTDGNVSVEGEITAKTVRAEKLEILEPEAATATSGGSIATGSAVTAKSIGEGILEAGTTTIVIETTSITENSIVFVTPKTKTSLSLAVTSQIPGESFTVEVLSAPAADVKFNWWVVN